MWRCRTGSLYNQVMNIYMHGIKINKQSSYKSSKNEVEVVEALSRPERPAADWGQVLESKDKPCTIECCSLRAPVHGTLTLQLTWWRFLELASFADSETVRNGSFVELVELINNIEGGMEILRMGYPLSIDRLYTGIIYLYIISIDSNIYIL